ncbi:hypothetical protein ACX1C1_21545 [Paenibacillus sp. strain BS8-2]
MNAAIKESISKILNDDSSNKLLIKSITLLKPSKRRFWTLVVFLCFLCALYLFFFVNHVDALKSTKKIIENTQTLILAIFAIVITGYSIFQALTNGKTLIALLKVSVKERSKFQEYNYFFFSLSMLYLFIIVFNYVAIIILDNIPPDWSLPGLELQTNNIFYSFLMGLYITIILNSVLEMKCFIYNLYQLFSSHAIASAIQQLKEDEKTP